jgi:hypothetical protein
MDTTKIPHMCGYVNWYGGDAVSRDISHRDGLAA